MAFSNDLMDFDTFCTKMEEYGAEPGAAGLVPLIHSNFEQKVPLKPRFHKKAMQLWLSWLILGGLPESLQAYADAYSAALPSGGPEDIAVLRAFAAADLKKREALAKCRAEIGAIRPRYRCRVSAVFEKLPGFLSAHGKKVNFRKITAGTYGDQYEQAFEWMENSGIFRLCRRSGEPGAGLAVSASDSTVKCYLADTGLLLSLAYGAEELADGSICRNILAGKLSMDGCMLYENAVAQMLSASGHSLFYYEQYSLERHRNEIEIDFLIRDSKRGSGKLIPIEVKSGRNCSLSSMRRFRQKYEERIAECYLIHPRNLEQKDGVWCIPPYMAGCI